MEDIISGPGRSWEMDSLLFNSLDNLDCTLRICSLQKLKVFSLHMLFMSKLNDVYSEIALHM